MMDREFQRGFLKLYVLWSASQAETYGVKIMDEMRELGFKISPGTLYPVLHSLLEEKDLTVTDRLVNGKIRKCYCATARGRREAEEVIERLTRILRKVFKARRLREDDEKNDEPNGVGREFRGAK
jgi:PadR family transcriptional regulator, regulatory protein PadR